MKEGNPMKDLRVERYNADEVAAKKRQISKRATAAGSAALLTLGLFNLVGDSQGVENEPPQTPAQIAPQDNDFSKLVVTFNENGVFELHNPTDQTISTKGAYWGRSSGSRQWRMPAVVIRAGETVLVRMKDDNETLVLKNMQTNFFGLNPESTTALTTVPTTPQTTMTTPNTTPGGSGSWFTSYLERI